SRYGCARACLLSSDARKAPFRVGGAAHLFEILGGLRSGRVGRDRRAPGLVIVAGTGRCRLERGGGHCEDQRNDQEDVLHCHGFLHITFSSAWRFSSRTTLSARRSASGSAAGFSTRSAQPPEAWQTIS